MARVKEIYIDDNLQRMIDEVKDDLGVSSTSDLIYTLIIMYWEGL